METLFSILQETNDYLWGYVVITALVFCALFFTYKIRGAQFWLLRDMIKAMGDKPLFKHTHTGKAAKDTEAAKDELKKIGSFQAFAVSLSSRVGTGNLAGVASAIFIGGPGAVFWMWVMALFGAATAFVEATLAQLYKKRGADSFYGGPAYYMQQGLHRKWMGVLFAILITITFGMANQVVQSNTLCDALSDSLSIDRQWIGLALTLATLIIIFGGIRRISRFSSIVVPFMAIGYAVLAIVIIIINIQEIPAMLSLIVREAFGLDSAAGGAVGIAVTQGVKRGLFSNEAGEGSAPNAAAIAHTSHPVKQGLLQALGVFTDTIIVCSCTAFIILLSGIYDSGRDGIILTKYALETHIGQAGGLFITAAIFFFAYSTIIANYFYGETNIRFITKKKSYVNLFRIITAATIMAGALISLQEAWSIVDLAMGIMTLVNLAAIVQLSPKVFFLLDNYMRQRRQGRDPVFTKDMMPQGSADVECWEKAE
ncbi:MAG: alanine/glycine:cation symporter family protein [Bacteroidaceae bacterium]|nr:alanine/glycine:cation symporter family protein [Bacteroidaceae bacterium]